MIYYPYLAFLVMCILWILFCFAFFKLGVRPAPAGPEVPPTSVPLDRFVQPLSAPSSSPSRYMIANFGHSMGAEGGGNMFPGVALPFGVVKLGIDVQPPPGRGDPYSGYHPEGAVTGFSMMHESGTGGAPKYGVVSQLPVVGNVSNPLLNHAVARSAVDEAGLGWYRANLANGVVVELSASRHAGIIRHSFPVSASGSSRNSSNSHTAAAAGAEKAQPKNVLVDVSHFLPSSRSLGIEQHYVEGAIAIDGDDGDGVGRYTGYGVYSGGWNHGNSWTIFFCGQFSLAPAAAATFEGTGETLESFGTKGRVSGPKRLGALFTFEAPSSSSPSPPPLVVESRIGISWISEDRACQFIRDEIPTGDGAYGQLVQATKDAWNTEVLSKVATTETDVQKLQLLYSSLYGMFLLPSDRTGENPGWHSQEPYYDDILTLWDTFRSHTPLFHILLPDRYTDFIRSLVDTWRHDGWLPDGRSSNHNGRVQGGSNADNVLSDARVKGVGGGVNWDDAYAAMLTDAEVVPPNSPKDPQAPDSSTGQGRGALGDWKTLGLITTRYSRSVSRASEYAVNDFCVAQVAKSLGRTADHARYAGRSKNWRNHWDRRMTVFGFSGFLSPIVANSSGGGSFPQTPQNPLSCDGCYWKDPYYEALPFEYSFGALHDAKAMIELMGGDDAFIARLEKLFEPGANPAGDARFGKTLFNPGNEPSFASPYLFNFVPGNQWRSVARSRHIARSYYKADKKGLPGNSDAGAMQSWLLWSIIGLYPVTGTTTFLIGAPQFSLSIDLGRGNKLVVSAQRRGGGEDDGAWFVQSLAVNGKRWRKSWVDWADVFENGGTMEFVLGPRRTRWDVAGERPLWNLV